MVISRIFGATSLVGGGYGALDKILVIGKNYTLSDGYASRATLYNDPTYDDGVYSYVIVDSGLAENPPYVIKPDQETQGVPYTGTLRWHFIKHKEPNKNIPIQIRAEDFKLGAPGPSEPVIGNFSVLEFTGSGAAQSAYSSFHIPTDWAIGTDIDVDVHWAPVDDSTGTVVWQMSWSAVASNANEILDGTSTITFVLDDAQLLQDELLQTDNMTISGASLTREDTIGICIFRDPSHISDDYVSGASLVWIDIKIYRSE